MRRRQFSAAVAIASLLFCVNQLFAQFGDGDSKPPKKEAVPELVYKDGYAGVKKLFEQAVVAGDLEICKELLEKNAYYVNEVDAKGLTQLYYAASNGQKELCALLLQHGAKADIVPGPNAGERSESRSPLDIAVFNNETETALLLIESLGPDALKAKRNCNKQAVFFAILNENIDILKALIKRGADLNVPTQQLGSNATYTPLQVACAVENVDICKLLLESGAKPDFKLVDFRAAQAIFIPALGHNEAICKLLIDAKIDLNVRNPKGKTVLHELLTTQKPLLFARASWSVPAKSIVDPYPRPKEPGQSADEEDESSGEDEKLAEADEYRFCKLFVDARADLAVRDKSDCSIFETLIFSQIQQGHESPGRSFDAFKKLIDLLVAAKIDLNAKDKNGWTPLNYLLFYALLDGRENKPGLKEEAIKELAQSKIELFKTLIEAGATVKTADKDGNTLLHYAVGAPGTVLQKGDFNFPLNYDARGRHRVFCRLLVELLLEKGASLNDENKAGETPFDWAMRGPQRIVAPTPKRSMHSADFDASPAMPASERAVAPQPSNQKEAVDMLFRQ